MRWVISDDVLDACIAQIAHAIEQNERMMSSSRPKKSTDHLPDRYDMLIFQKTKIKNRHNLGEDENPHCDADRRVKQKAKDQNKDARCSKPHEHGKNRAPFAYARWSKAVI